jgi:chromate transport protein ChrA
MTTQNFVDCLAIGNVIPSPLVIIVTFIGFMGDRWVGAVLMTIGMFLPAFSFIILHDLLEAVGAWERGARFMSLAGGRAVSCVVHFRAVCLLLWVGASCGIYAATPRSMAVRLRTPGNLFAVKNDSIADFLDGVTVGVVGLIGIVALELLKASDCALGSRARRPKMGPPFCSRTRALGSCRVLSASVVPM